MSRNIPKIGQLLINVHLVFKNFQLILEKCNTITAELLENETVKFHPPSAAAVLTNDIKLNRILKQQTKEI